MKLKHIVILTIANGAAFGYWQKSYEAGCFMAITVLIGFYFVVEFKK